MPAMLRGREYVLKEYEILRRQLLDLNQEHPSLTRAFFVKSSVDSFLLKAIVDELSQRIADKKLIISEQLMLQDQILQQQSHSHLTMEKFPLMFTCLALLDLF